MKPNICLVCLAVTIATAVTGCGDDDPTDPSTAVSSDATTAATSSTSVSAPDDLAITVPDSPYDAVLAVPASCFAPDTATTLTLTNSAETTLYYCGFAFLFDHYPQRETGRWLDMGPTPELSPFQPRGVVELPSIGYAELPARTSKELGFIAPPDLGSWTLVAPIGSDVGGSDSVEVVFSFEVATDCG